MRQIHGEAVTPGPDLTFAPASNFAAESPAVLPDHRKILQLASLLLQKYGTYIIKKEGNRNYNRNLAPLKNSNPAHYGRIADYSFSQSQITTSSWLRVICCPDVSSTTYWFPESSTISPQSWSRQLSSRVQKHPITFSSESFMSQSGLTRGSEYEPRAWSDFGLGCGCFGLLFNYYHRLHASCPEYDTVTGDTIGVLPLVRLQLTSDLNKDTFLDGVE